MALYKLEELVAYQLSMDLKKQVFELIYNSPAQHDAKLAGQISDAASSVPSNIAEGFYRFNPAEFANFVKYAQVPFRRSARDFQMASRNGITTKRTSMKC